MTATAAIEPRDESVSVPCNGCTACCRYELILLFPGDGDDVASFEHELIEYKGDAVPVLKRQSNGDCVYLGPAGCSIHGRAPMVCRTFDCRSFFKGLTRTARRFHIARNPRNREIFEAGRSRLHTLGAP